ncbi:chymotrypsin inhibitor Ani s 6-like [Onthophagus taurus]|uniref:chymotrypsin inhibitor Ani s 6-like n=1 Tax=Onthophagus taurus TaxID=166361 RepID=UPI000C2010C0|nr:zonadhesin-like [Onthophagus taurus]
MLFYIVLISCVFATISADEKCTAPNTQFNYCGSPCDETCDGKPEYCAEVCVQRCECVPGYVVHKSECVPREYCEQLKCNDPNMEYTKCGTYCPNTCETPEISTCIDMCFEGCQCKDGYVLHDFKCIKLEDCPTK